MGQLQPQALLFFVSGVLHWPAHHADLKWRLQQQAGQWTGDVTYLRVPTKAPAGAGNPFRLAPFIPYHDHLDSRQRFRWVVTQWQNPQGNCQTGKVVCD